MGRHRQPLEAAIGGLAGLDVWLAPDLTLQHPSYGAIRGDAADAEVASRQLRTLLALRAMLPELDPKPADLIDLEDRLDWVCEQLVRAGGRADPP